MTFKQFEKIVKSKMPTVTVTRHGDYCSNKSKNTLGIIYENGKVYSYSGSYDQVLYKIGIRDYIIPDTNIHMKDGYRVKEEQI